MKFEPTRIIDRWIVIIAAVDTVIVVGFTNLDLTDCIASILTSGVVGMFIGLLLAFRSARHYAAWQWHNAHPQIDHSHCTVVVPDEVIAPKPWLAYSYIDTVHGRMQVWDDCEVKDALG